MMHGGGGGRSMNIEGELKKKVFDGAIFKRLGSYAKPYKVMIFFISLVILATVAVEISLPLISKHIIDSFIKNTGFVTKLDLDNNPDKSVLVELDNNLFYCKRGNEKKLSQSTKDLVDNGRLPDEYILIDKNISEDFTKDELLNGMNYCAVSVKTMEKKDSDFISRIRYSDLSSITFFSLTFVVLVIAGFGFTYLQIYLTAITGQKVMYDIRMNLFSHMERMPVKFFESNPTGVLVTRVTNDINNLSEFFSDVLVNLFKDFFVVLGIFVVLFVTDTRLALVTVSAIPIIVFVSYFFKKQMREVFRWTRKALARVNAILSETITGMTIIQIFNQEEKENRKFREANDDLFKASYRQMLMNSVFRPTFSVIRFGTIALIIYFSAGYISKETLTIGALVAFLAYIEKFFQPIQDLSEKINLMQSAMASSERIFDLMDMETEDYESHSEVEVAGGDIVFENVWFAYKEGEWILKDFSLKIKRGESIAIVGATGAGKTTIINILNRFYPISKGDIKINGISIYSMSLDKLRSLIGMVQQDIFIFSGSIKENILLGMNMPENRLKEISTYSNAYQFISKLEDEFDTHMKESGTNISVGEKQLVAFTRLLANNPEIMILDEATSSVDTETELLIQDSIERLQKGRTSIIIAHRLSTIRNCTKIIVLHKGKIMEMGTHEELLNREQLYYNLYKLQYE
ncbi:MAG: ABC transporter ATP-binding protein [Candidatus Delongbacteria bacterium]|nr:ABC transporter ATP-binding protein [Candidatus Delongbacteria bacterium]MBN2835599.1 ABC transporter ATP-binding protein [Candidatus Delongbacteria bacterium]